MTLYDCVECGLPAEVLDYYLLASTDGNVMHCRILCAGGHFFNGPVDRVRRRSAYSEQV